MNELNLEDYDEDTINVIKEARQDIRIAVAERFGNPVATSCISIARGPTPWNGYEHDNHKGKREELGDGNMTL